MPIMEVGNVAIKGLLHFLKGSQVAGLILGAAAPVVMTSRSEPPSAKLYATALGMPRRPERLIACEVSMFRILVINPGSTSTKIAEYEDEGPAVCGKPRPRYRQTVPGGHGAV